MFLAICPAQIWAARITLTEILAQFLFFLACYCFAAGWERGQKSRSLLGGFFLGISLMVRIDAYIYGLGLLFLTAYCAIFNRKALQYLRPGAALYALLGAFAMIWGLLFSRSYFTSHLESGSLKLIALANVLLLVLTGFLDILGALLAKKRPQKDWLCLMFASKKGALFTSLAFLAGFALLYFLRPILPHGEKASSIFASRSMIEFCWYISIPAVLLAIYGLYRFLREHGEKVAILFVFFAIGISNLLVYLLWPSITPDHIWASRRWITVCIPVSYTHLFTFFQALFSDRNELCLFRFFIPFIAEIKKIERYRFHERDDRMLRAILCKVRCISCSPPWRQALRGKAAALWAKLNDTRLARTHHLRRAPSPFYQTFLASFFSFWSIPSR